MTTILYLGWVLAAEIDPHNGSYWNYDSAKWTTCAEFKDGGNAQYEAFCHETAEIKIVNTYNSNYLSLFTIYNLHVNILWDVDTEIIIPNPNGIKSLQETFASGQSYSTSLPLDTWRGFMGPGVASWQQYCMAFSL